MVDPVGVLDKALEVAFVIKKHIIAFKQCPKAILIAREEVDSCEVLLRQARQSSQIPKNELFLAVKPILTSLEAIQQDVEKFMRLNQVVLFFKASAVIELLELHRNSLRNNLGLLQTITSIKPSPSSIIPDDDARIFWVSNFGDQNSTIYSSLEMCLAAKFPAEMGKFSSLLKNLLDMNDDGDVSLQEFAKFILWFRPFEKLPENLEKVLSTYCFHVDKDFNFNNHLKAGTCCFKLSLQSTGYLSIYYKGLDNQLKGKKVFDNLGNGKLPSEEEKGLSLSEKLLPYEPRAFNLPDFMATQSLGTRCCNQLVKKTGPAIYDLPLPPKMHSVDSLQNLKEAEQKEMVSDITSSTFSVLLKKLDSGDIYTLVETDDFLALYLDEKSLTLDPTAGLIIFFAQMANLEAIPRGMKFKVGGVVHQIITPSSEKADQLFNRVLSKTKARSASFQASIRNSSIYSIN